MKAAICYEFGQPLVIEDIAIQMPQRGEVKVTLAACAICHSDIHYAEGAWGGTLPAVYGHEAAGVVTGLGEDVRGYELGDHVVVSLIRFCGNCSYCLQGVPTQCQGDFVLNHESRLYRHDGQKVVQGLRTAAFAEEIVVDQSQLVKIPKDMPLESASLLACGVITGLGAVTRTVRVPTGHSVVVIGTGGVGLNALQGARLSGAQPIIAVDIVAAKLEAAKQFGATHVLNSEEQDVPALLREVTQGHGADFVFVTVGSAKAMAQGLELLRPQGTLVLVGMPATGTKLAFEVADFADAGQRIVGSKMGSVRPHLDIPKLVDLYQHGRLKLDELITSRYALDDINEAIAAVKRGKALRNVIVF